MDLHLSNFEANRSNLAHRGAFKANSPEIYEFDQLEPVKADLILSDVPKGDSADIVIDDGHHSIESIDITFNAVRPYFSDKFVCFIEDNFNTYNRLARRHSSYNWTSHGEMTIVNRSNYRDCVLPGSD